jgi:hypothetical protein
LSDLLGRKHKQSRQKDKGHHGEKGRKNSLNAASVKAQVTEAAAAEFCVDLSADKVAGDHKKYIDAGESAGDSRHARVIEHHAENRNGAETVDVGTIRAA